MSEGYSVKCEVLRTDRLRSADRTGKRELCASAKHCVRKRVATDFRGIRRIRLHERTSRTVSLRFACELTRPHCPEFDPEPPWICHRSTAHFFFMTWIWTFSNSWKEKYYNQVSTTFVNISLKRESTIYVFEKLTKRMIFASFKLKRSKD